MIIEREYLETDRVYFLHSYSTAEEYKGWKYTIVGDNMDDLYFLYDQLYDFLVNIKANFKFGTKKLVECNSGEQMYKLLTIYIYGETNAELLLEDLKHFLKDYNPKCKLIHSEHIIGAIYKRVDTDANGNYIPADRVG